MHQDPRSPLRCHLGARAHPAETSCPPGCRWTLSVQGSPASGPQGTIPPPLDAAPGDAKPWVCVFPLLQNPLSSVEGSVTVTVEIKATLWASIPVPGRHPRAWGMSRSQGPTRALCYLGAHDSSGPQTGNMEPEFPAARLRTRLEPRFFANPPVETKPEADSREQSGPHLVPRGSDGKEGIRSGKRRRPLRGRAQSPAPPCGQPITEIIHIHSLGVGRAREHH